MQNYFEILVEKYYQVFFVLVLEGIFKVLEGVSKKLGYRGFFGSYFYGGGIEGLGRFRL